MIASRSFHPVNAEALAVADGLKAQEEKESTTRATLYLGGFVIKQVKQRNCHLTVLGEVDF